MIAEIKPAWYSPCTLGVCAYVSRMAKKTIKAIELLSKSQGPAQR
jgi:hypothetical protein